MKTLRAKLTFLVFLFALILACRLDVPAADSSNFWLSRGEGERIFSDGSREVDLGNGLKRIEWNTGRAEILGMTHEGRPVTYILYGNNELWHYNLEELAASLRSREISFKLSGHAFRIFSEHPLNPNQLKNIGMVIAETPTGIFEANDSNHSIFVADSLGEVRAIGESFVPLGGLHDAETGSVFIRTKELDGYHSAAYVFRHELGHVMDAAQGWLSRTLTDKNGNLLFGSGTVALDKQGQVNLKESSFESRYASTNANEDFAETHEFLLRIREDYNKAHQGFDLFKLNAKQFREELAELGISSLLQDKMSAIFLHVYAPPSMADLVPLSN